MDERNIAQGFVSYHPILVLDGSGSMQDNEQASGKPKHKAVAEMVQKLINMLHEDPQFEDTYLTIVAYDGENWKDVRLEQYNVQMETHVGEENYDRWDPLSGHGGGTPIGHALEYARQMAENWIEQASGQERRRAIIYLLSDGMNNIGPDGMSEKQAIQDFNQATTKGVIRLATVGYFQHPEGADNEEDEGRRLLKQLVTNPGAYFESNDVNKILNYIKQTITLG